MILKKCLESKKKKSLFYFIYLTTKIKNHFLLDDCDHRYYIKQMGSRSLILINQTMLYGFHTTSDDEAHHTTTNQIASY